MKMSPVANSTSGYMGEMGSPQLRHLPRRSSQPKTGMLSYGLIGLRQRGEREPGETMERPSGMREMQTFRKLPMTMPKRKKKNGITVSTVPQAGRRLNAGCDGACRMANGWTGIPIDVGPSDLDWEGRRLGSGSVSAKLEVYGDEPV